MIHPRGIGGDADTAFASVTDQAADAGEEAVEVAGDPAGGITARRADWMRQVGMAVGDRVDVAVNFVKSGAVAEQSHDIVS